MKILVINTCIFPVPLSGYGGLEHIAYQCAEGLAKLGHDVTLAACEGSQTKHSKLLVCGPRGTGELQATATYGKVLKNFDVVIDHTWNKWALHHRNKGSAPPVLSVMHAPVNTMMQSPPPEKKACFVCLSWDQWAHLRAQYEREGRTCYNGVDTNFYKEISGIRTERFLFLARFSSIKGPHLAIEACLEAGVGLDLVGDTTITNEPEYLELCKNLARKAPKGQIEIHGNAGRGECVWWFSRAKALLHPNRDFREPFGLAPVEAQLCGCPVIAWDRGAMKETVVPGETGAIVRDEKQLKEAIDWYKVQESKDPRDISSRCREWAMKFSVENMVRRYDELCVEAVEKGPW